MKRVLFTSVLALLCIVQAKAQEPAICGDWTGVYESWDIVDRDGSKQKVYRDYKRYIRVKLIDGCYTVRMKTRIADESLPFTYAPECQIIEANERMIKWKMNLGQDYEWSPSATHKGIPIGHADYYNYCTIILSNGTLKYSDHMLTIYYNKQGQEIDKESTPEIKMQTLYKDDSDW